MLPDVINRAGQFLGQAIEQYPELMIPAVSAMGAGFQFLDYCASMDCEGARFFSSPVQYLGETIGYYASPTCDPLCNDAGNLVYHSFRCLMWTGIAIKTIQLAKIYFWR